MIQGFSTIIQQDVVQIIDYLKGKGPQDDDQQRRVSLAAMRMLATLGMALSLIISASCLTIVASAPVGAVLLLAAGVALYAFFHDVFIISKNMTEQMDLIPLAVSTGRALWKDFKDLWNGKKNLDDAPRQPITEGTFFRSLWDKLLAELAAEQQT